MRAAETFTISSKDAIFFPHLNVAQDDHLTHRCWAKQGRLKTHNVRRLVDLASWLHLKHNTAYKTKLPTATVTSQAKMYESYEDSVDNFSSHAST